MTTNTNDIPRTTLLLAAARAMNISDLDAHTVLDAALDFDVADYDDDNERRALHTLANSLFSSDDDFDDFRLELRHALDI